MVEVSHHRPNHMILPAKKNQTSSVRAFQDVRYLQSRTAQHCFSASSALFLYSHHCQSLIVAIRGNGTTMMTVGCTWKMYSLRTRMTTVCVIASIRISMVEVSHHRPNHMILPANKIKLRVSGHFQDVRYLQSRTAQHCFFSVPAALFLYSHHCQSLIVAIRGNGTTMMTVGCTWKMYSLRTRMTTVLRHCFNQN